MPITRRDDVERVADAVKACGRMGLDTEFVRERTYRARLCLVQVATDGAIWLIDTHEGADPGPVAKLVADPEVEVVVHAGRQDLDILHDRFGAVPTSVFDVQVAAGFAGYGASLPLGRLASAVAGVSLPKGESYTDWCRRPLTPSQLNYAAADVRFLLPIADRLKDELARRGRTSWVREEMLLLESIDSYASDPRRAWRRVAGHGALTPRQRAVLKELAAWREEAAAKRDLPRSWVVKDPTLIEIARRQPTTVAGLKAIRGLNAREVERSGAAILAAVAAGRSAAPVEHDAAAWSRGVLLRARMTAGLADAVARARCEKEGVAVELVVTRGEMESLLAELFADRLDAGRHRVLQGWRRELVGRHILALARGETALRAVDVPPYIEEVSV